MYTDRSYDDARSRSPVPQLQRGRDTFLAPSLLPLQFESLEHLDARVDAARKRAAEGEGLSPATARWLAEAYRAFRRYLKDVHAETTFLSGQLPRQLQLIDDWVGWLRTREISRATISSYWRGMRMLCTRLTRQDGVVNPFAFIRAPHPGYARLRCLTQDAAERILHFAWNDAGFRPPIRARNAAIVGVMLLAGLRKAETLHLDIEDVDFQEKVIRVRAGKGQHGGKPRTVPMTKQLRSICEAYFSYREKAATASGAFFLGSHGSSRLSDATLRRLFRRASERTGIHVTPHMLRHTFCTLLSKMGISDRLAREAMGHADYRMLQRYQHVYEGEVAEEMEAKLELNLEMGFEGRGVSRAGGARRTGPPGRTQPM